MGWCDSCVAWGGALDGVWHGVGHGVGRLVVCGMGWGGIENKWWLGVPNVVLESNFHPQYCYCYCR